MCTYLFRLLGKKVGEACCWQMGEMVFGKDRVCADFWCGECVSQIFPRFACIIVSDML